MLTGSETLNELRAALTQRLTRGEELAQAEVKGDLSSDEIAEMGALRDEIKSYQDAIANFPKADGFREQIHATKSYLRKPAGTPPPLGRSSGGDGAALKSHDHGGSPGGHFAIHGTAIKSLGSMLADEVKAQRANHLPTPTGTRQGSWGVEFPGFDRALGFVIVDALGETRPYKADLDLTAAPLTGYDRLPGVVDIQHQRLTIADLLMQRTTTRPTHRYIRQVSYTNAATAVAMGGTKPEASWDLIEVDAAVRKIAVTAKVPDEMFEDYEDLRSFVDGDLRFMVMEHEEAQILNGNGTAPNMRGILQTVGIQTESSASAADNIEAVMRGLTKVQAVGHYMPDGLVLHPNDYRDLRLTRDNNNQFYGGGPFTGAYGNQPMPSNPGVWAQRTVVTTAIAEGTILVGNFARGAGFVRRSGLMVQATNTNEDDFITNKITIRVEERGVVAVYRPLAFCAVSLA